MSLIQPLIKPLMAAPSMRNAALLLLMPVLGLPSAAPRPSLFGAAPASNGVAAVAGDPAPRWQRQSSGAFLDSYDNFTLAGFPPTEANRLAHIAAFGTAPTAGSAGCSYYVVTAYYSEGGTRRYRLFNVGTVCIENLTGSCPVLNCPPGEKAFFKLTTAANCKPDQSCVWIDISQVYSSSQPDICDHLVDCSCWPGLGCAARECVPMSGTPSQPKGCPSCR